jgi:prepilin-type N-terminal cleavage/methylation domain-containing protein
MNKKGFTLIEVLIVVSIIGILASVVLVGLGEFRKRGRDTRRIADLQQVRNALELYYSKCGIYPGTPACGSGAPAGDWVTGVSASLTGAGIGVSSIPRDPLATRTYTYGVSGDNQSYVLRAVLEDVNHPSLKDDVDGTVYGVDCADSASAGNYCVQL